MLKKNVMKPISLVKLEALSRRLMDASPKKQYIEETLSRLLAGFSGEKSLLFQLSYLPSDWSIFHDLRLHDGIHHFQLDFLIVTADSILVLEVKNLAGRLVFDGHRQLIQERESGIRGADSPIAQVSRHERQLKQWLAAYDFPPMPIASLIVLTNANSYFETDHPNVLRASMLQEHLPISGENPLPEPIRHALTEKLLSAHEPLLTNPVKTYDIDPHHIRRGVFCPACSRIMERKRGEWYCFCGHQDKRAHREALRDYSMLKNREISAREAAIFLRLKSADTARRLLVEEGYRKIGRGNFTKYEIRTF